MGHRHLNHSTSPGPQPSAHEPVCPSSFREGHSHNRELAISSQEGHSHSASPPCPSAPQTLSTTPRPTPLLVSPHAPVQTQHATAPVSRLSSGRWVETPSHTWDLARLAPHTDLPQGHFRPRPQRWLARPLAALGNTQQVQGHGSHHPGPQRAGPDPNSPGSLTELQEPPCPGRAPDPAGPEGPPRASSAVQARARSTRFSTDHQLPRADSPTCTRGN